MQPTPEGNARGDALSALRALADSVDGLRQGVVDDAEQRRQEAAEAQRRQRRTMRVVLFAVLAAVLLLGGLLTVTIQNKGISKQNGDIAKQIADCTTNERGECYRTSQRRTGQALGSIRQDNVWIAIYVQQCSKVAQTDDELEDCVLRKLDARATPQPTPQPTPRPTPGPTVPASPTPEPPTPSPAG